VAVGVKEFTIVPIGEDLYEVRELDDIEAFEGPKGRTPGAADFPVLQQQTSRTARTVGTGPLDTGGLIRWFDLDFAKNKRDVPEFKPVTDDGRVIDVLTYDSHGAADRTDLHQGSAVHTGSYAVPWNLITSVQSWVE
jgi:hypothetical protein